MTGGGILHFWGKPTGPAAGTGGSKLLSVRPSQDSPPIGGGEGRKGREASWRLTSRGKLKIIREMRGGGFFSPSLGTRMDFSTFEGAARGG